MGTHPIFESDFDCLTDRFRTFVNFILKSHVTKPLPYSKWSKGIDKHEKQLYLGITASLLREMVYSSLRFGLYEPFMDTFAKIVPMDHRQNGNRNQGKNEPNQTRRQERTSTEA